jgi:hypothetical protein
MVIATDEAAPANLQVSMIHDLAAISVRTGRLELPAYTRQTQPEVTLDRLREFYDASDVDGLVWNPYWKTNFLISESRADSRDLLWFWLRTVTAHPVAYLSHRAQVLLTILQMRGIKHPFHQGIDPNDLGVSFKPSLSYAWVISVVDASKDVFFRGWLYFSIASVVVAFGLDRRRMAASLVCASGMLYVMAYGLFSTGSEFRYIWWLVVSTLLGVFMLFTDSTEDASPSGQMETCVDAIAQTA